MKTVRLKMSPFRISFFQIALLESGGGVVSSDGSAYELGECTLFFNLPGQIIYWEVPQDWRGHYINLGESFYTVSLDDYQRLYDFPFFKAFSPAIQLKNEEAQQLIDLMNQVEVEYKGAQLHNKTVIKGYLSTILALCNRFYDRHQQDTIDHNKISSIGERFKEVVHHHLKSLVLNTTTEAITVSGSADKLFVTPKYLSEAIKKELGLTPTEYINSRLIKEAQKLLVSTDLQAKEISYLLGFQDSSYFNRLFKKTVKLSPLKYREENS